MSFRAKDVFLSLSVMHGPGSQSQHFITASVWLQTVCFYRFLRLNVMTCTVTPLLVPQCWRSVWNDSMERCCAGAARFSGNKQRQRRGEPSFLRYYWISVWNGCKDPWKSWCYRIQPMFPRIKVSEYDTHTSVPIQVFGLFLVPTRYDVYVLGSKPADILVRVCFWQGNVASWVCQRHEKMLVYPTKSVTPSTWFNIRERYETWPLLMSQKRHI